MIYKVLDFVDDVFYFDLTLQSAWLRSLIFIFLSASFSSQSALLQRSLRRSLEEDAKAAALRERSLLEEIKSLKSQLADKEKERVDTVETLNAIETRCISMEAKLEGKTEEYSNLKKNYEKIEREKRYLEKKATEKDQSFHDKCTRLWELCKNFYDKFGAKPEDPCWKLGEFDPFFG